MGERSDTETRADVARRLDRPETYGPSSYEIGGADDPDWAEDDPGLADTAVDDTADETGDDRA